MRSTILVTVFTTLFLQPGAGVPSDYAYYYEGNTEGDYSFTDFDEYAIHGTRPSFLFSKFVSRSLNLKAEVGGSVTFPCNPDIQGDFSVSWMRGNGQQIFLNGTRSLEDDRFQLVNGTSLKISDVDPSDSGQYVCQVATVTEMEQDHTLKVISPPSFVQRCPNKSEKWIDLGGDYCFLIEQERRVSWIEAVHECYKEGGYLATLRSMEEVKRIRSYFKSEERSLHIGLWRHSDGSSEWVDKSRTDFRNWKIGQFGQWDEICVQINTATGKMINILCRNEIGYICSSLKDETPPVQEKVCPDASSEWNDYGGEYCYIIEMYNETSWDSAAELCSAAGGSLASFHSVQEISVVTEQTKHHNDRLHIGFRQNSDEAFEWMDRSPVDLSFWDHGEPNLIEERCAEMDQSTGRWNDITCDKRLGYICSTPKVNPEMLKTELPAPTEAEICGGIITTESGTIQSPNYPENYGSNENCFWKITVPENYKIALSFEAIELEYGASCEFDYVEVLDGHEPDGTVRSKLCGSDVRQTVLSLGNKMSVKFSSDKVNQRPGFLATFKKVKQCGGTIVAEEGIIRSPNYPDNYWSNDICTWKIIVPENNGILLKFETFELEHTSRCTADYVEVLDGHEESSRILGRYCGPYVLGETLSSGHKITVRFVSDGSKEYYGFSAEFKTAEPAYLNRPVGPLPAEETCGGVIDSEYGILLSPNYPGDYRPDEYCIWTIKPPSGSRINLRFKTFELEETSGWCYDYVEIYDGPSIFSLSLGKFCGESLPDVNISTGNEMTVRFKTDSSSEYQGFTAVFNTEEIDSEEFEYGSQREGICGGRISDDEGIIESPNYPEKYGPNQNCIWRITVPPNNQVVLKFNAFEVETHMGCMYDYVLVRDGDGEGSYILDKLCGYDIPSEIRSSGNKMMIQFKSDSSIEYSGFAAEFKKDLQAVSTGLSPQRKGTCGGDMYSNDGTIESPYYPEPYGPLENCIWKITVPENYIIALKFDFLDVESNKECTLDYVTILDGSEEESPVLKKICNYHHDGKDTIWSSKNKMTVKFVSDDSIERPGFSATFRKAVLCGGDIVADSGILQGPDHTEGLPYICKWNITVPEGSRVLLRISGDQNITSEDGSFGVYIPDSDGLPVQYNEYSDEQNVFRSKSNEMTVVVESDGSQGLHFQAQFETDTCGEDITAEEGSVYSPNYPSDYPADSYCTWKITVPAGNRVVLNFTSLDIENSNSCEYDYVTVLDGHDFDSEVLGKFCGEHIPDLFRTSNNKMAVRFTSDYSLQKQGFTAEFWKEPATYPDIEEILRQLPHIIYEQTQQKRMPLFGKKNHILKKRHLLDTMKAVLKF